MLINFLKKHSNSKKDKKILLERMIWRLNINNDQKELYINSLDIIDEKSLDNLYKSITNFMENSKLEDIKKASQNNFSSISGMRKKEAIEKQKDINSFSFLLSNV